MVSTVCIGAFMAALDAGIVNVAMPSFVRAFPGAGPGSVAWVSIAYLLTLDGLLAAFGHLADLVGRRLMYTLGFLLFILGSALCGAAPALDGLILFRVLQAGGAALLQANSVAIITGTVPEHHRGQALGVQGSAQAVGLTVGPAVGGLLLARWGWRAIFYVNVPVGLLGIVAAGLILPRDPRVAPEPFDFVGTLLYVPALGLLLLAFTQGSGPGGLSPALAPALTGAALLAALFWRRERRLSFPVIPPALFASRAFSTGVAGSLLAYMALFAATFTLPFFLERVFHLPPAGLGLLMVPVPLALSLLSPAGGWLSDRVGARWICPAGMLATALGAALLATLDAAAGLVALVGAMLVLGAGFGLFNAPNNSVVMGASPHHHLGVAGGILNMARSTGMSMGVALAGAVFGSLLRVGHPALLSYHAAFWCTAGLALLAALVTASRGEATPAHRRGIDHRLHGHHWRLA